MMISMQTLENLDLSDASSEPINVVKGFSPTHFINAPNAAQELSRTSGSESDVCYRIQDYVSRFNKFVPLPMGVQFPLRIPSSPDQLISCEQYDTKTNPFEI